MEHVIFSISLRKRHYFIKQFKGEKREGDIKCPLHCRC